MHGHVDRVEHLREQQRGGHGAGVAAALATLDEHGVGAPPHDLLGVTLRADRRDDDDATVLQPGDELRVRGDARSDATFTPSSTRSAHRPAASGWSARRFTPNGASVRAFASTIAGASCSKSIVAGRQDPEAARVRRRGREASARPPIPCPSGRPAPGSRRGRRARCAGSGASAGRAHAPAEPAGSRTSPQQRPARRRWAHASSPRARGRRAGTRVASWTIVDRDARVERTEPHAVVVGLEVEARRGSTRRGGSRGTGCALGPAAAARS